MVRWVLLLTSTPSSALFPDSSGPCAKIRGAQDVRHADEIHTEAELPVLRGLVLGSLTQVFCSENYFFPVSNLAILVKDPPLGEEDFSLPLPMHYNPSPVALPSLPPICALNSFISLHLSFFSSSLLFPSPSPSPSSTLFPFFLHGPSLFLSFPPAFFS